MKNILRAVAAILVAGFGVSTLAAAVSQFTAIISLPNVATLQSLGAASSFYPNIVVQEYSSGMGSGGGVFTWDPVSTTTTNRCTVFSASGVSTGRWRRASGRSSLSVQDCGAKGDNSTDDSAAEQAALDNVSVGGLVIFPSTSSCYSTLSTLTVTRAINIGGTGSVCFKTSDQPGFIVTSSDVTISGIGIVGPHFDTLHVNEFGVWVKGTLNAGIAPTYLSNISIRNTKISSWGLQGAEIDYVDGFNFTNNFVTNVVYGGMIMSSVSNFSVVGNTVNTVNGTGSVGGNAYGLSATRYTLDSGELTSQPRSSHGVFSGNTVIHVPTWTGIDTHSGENIAITGNSVYDTFFGVAVGASTDSANNPAYAPLNIVVSGNSLNSGVMDGSHSEGVTFTGVPGQMGTGNITGNTIINYGSQSAVNDSAINVGNTKALAITGNALLYPSPNGIYGGGANSMMTISGNTILDPWSNTSGVGRVTCVKIDGANEDVVIGDNSCQHIDKTATLLLTSTLGSAFLVTTDATNHAIVGWNKSNATTYLNATNTVAGPPLYPTLPLSCTNAASGSPYNNSGTLALCP